jgi:cobalt/nickel transport system permease protein
MHIADGIISNYICLSAHVVSISLVAYTGRKADADDIPVMGITGAALFVISLIHIPFAGTTLHLGLFGLAGILLGLRSIPVIYTVLLFQSLIFQHGGLMTLGVNVLNMSAGAYFAFLIWKWKVIPESIRAILAGIAGVFVPVSLMGIEFMLTGYGKGILLLFSIYIVAAIAEAMLTVGIVKFFRKIKSDILK